MTIQSKSLLNEFSESTEWLPHYDLSAYDSSTCRYLNDFYDRTMRAISPEHSIMWGDAHNQSGVLHLPFVGMFRDSPPIRGELLLDDVKGRSTLSGQADVTLKNNVIHFCLVVSFLINRFELDQNKVKKLISSLIEKGHYNDKGINILLHLHGDDVFFFFSNNSEDYKEFQQYMTDLGIKTGAESGPVYLKKIPNKTGTALVGIPGSLFKNRLGEYPHLNWLTLALSLIDNDASEDWGSIGAPDSVIRERQSLRQKEWDCCSFVARQFDRVMEDGSIVNGSSIIHDKLQLSKWLAYLIEYNPPKSVGIRSALKANLYKTGVKSEDAADFIKLLEESEDYATMSVDELADVFNSYSLASYEGDGSDQFGTVNRVRQLGKESLLKLARSIQDYILDERGRCPSAEDVSKMIGLCEISD